jgi:hypothetical protein
MREEIRKKSLEAFDIIYEGLPFRAETRLHLDVRTEFLRLWIDAQFIHIL